MKCECLQSDEQSDPTRTTEQFCGYQKDGFEYGCPDNKGCGQCTDKDPKKCNHGCPVLNQPASKTPPSAPPAKPAKKPAKKHHSTTPKKKSTNWWLYGGIIIAFLILIGIVFIVGNPSSSSNGTSVPPSQS